MGISFYDIKQALGSLSDDELRQLEDLITEVRVTRALCESEAIGTFALDSEADKPLPKEDITFTADQISEFRKIPKNGGKTSLKDLRELVTKAGITVTKDMQRKALCDALESQCSIKPSAQLLPKKVFTSDADQIDQWCKPLKDGGLKIAELRSRVADLGHDTTDLKRAQLVKLLKAGDIPQSVKVVDKAIPTSKSTLTVEMIAGWTKAPKDGGLGIADLKKKAKEYGIDVTGLKKADIIDAMNRKLEGVDEDPVTDFSVTMTKKDAERDLEWYIEVKDNELHCHSIDADGNMTNEIDKVYSDNDTAVAIAHGYINEMLDRGYSENDAESTPGPDSSPEPEQCEYVCLRGSQKGQQCTSKTSKGEKKCRKHSKVSSKASSKDSTSGVCAYVFKKGSNKGSNCTHKTVAGETMCGKHAGKDTETTTKTTKDEKPVEADPNGISVKRNRTVGKWYIDGTNLAVRSVKNKIVIGYITEEDVFIQDIPDHIHTQAEELGLECEA